MFPINWYLHIFLASYLDDFIVNEDEELSICSFTEGDAKIEGKILKSFSFDNSDEPIDISPNSSSLSTSQITASSPGMDSFSYPTSKALTCDDTTPQSCKEKIFDNRTSKANPNCRTPPVDGEIFDMVRTYTLRRSTVRILSKIKAIHMDDNVYLNTIVDEAIRYYYDYLKNNLR